MKPKFDLELFESLNESYRDRRLVPKPPTIDPPTYRRRAEQRIRTIETYIDLREKRVLEVGAGTGWLTALMTETRDTAEVVGVDIAEYSSWPEFRERGVKLLCGDLSRDALFPRDHFDVVVSSAVLEHVHHPISMVSALHELLRTGGQAWIYANLQRGPKASHRYREVFFPWPHLLFDDAVCRAFYRKNFGREKSFSWVNGMTLASYLQLFCEVGFDVTTMNRRTTPIDTDFYLRFEEQLSPYPAIDLETDFLEVVLMKSERPTGVMPYVGYTQAQADLERRLEQAREGPS